MLAALFVVVALAAVLWLAGRGNELFVLSIRDGELLVLRGRVPQGLLGDFRPIVRGVHRGQLVARREGDGARLQGRGLDATRMQRLRNLIGLRSAAQLLGAVPLRDPSIGQRLGIAGLAWWCERRRRGQ